MNRPESFISMTTTQKIGAALLLGCTLGASELAVAAGQTGAAAPASAQQGSAPPRSGTQVHAPTQDKEGAQVKALQKQLEAVQAQLRELAEQNRALLEHQKAIDRQLQQQQEQLAQQAAAEGQLNAQLQSGRGQGGVQSAAHQARPGQGQAAGPAGSNSAEPTSALPGTASTSSPLPDSTSVLPTATQAGGTSLGSFAQGVKLWGYGEIYYTDPLHDRDRAQADLARAVFGIGYTFDSRTEFNSEFEIEHAVSSADDPGEFEVEQFYIDHQIIDPVAVRAGLFLMPFGMLNEHHEPTNFYGVQRNFVETLIIPSTWREGGFNFHGDTQSGFGWNVGLTTGFDLSKWDFAPEFPQYTTALELINSDAGPLHATHQELALANAHDLSQYVSLSYFGLPGLTVGGAIFTGKAASVPAPPNAPIAGSQRVTLWEGHARWTPGKFDLSALYAHGSISNLAATNASNPGSPNPIPSSFYGYFFQAAYDVWQHGEYRLAPFTRWEVYNMGASYEGTPGPMIPVGDIPLTSAPGDYGPWPRNTDRVWTIGANFYITPHVVLKTDYQHFLINNGFTRFDLGLGVAF
jgi:phosphate-selective porin O/P